VTGANRGLGHAFAAALMQAGGLEGLCRRTLPFDREADRCRG
jgi:NAD(P)-dependent dehydrogenase (short-subunit alcohol dehydrogenase family)